MLSNMVMFIDLCTFNNGECENNYDDIYPDEPEFKKENESSITGYGRVAVSNIFTLCFGITEYASTNSFARFAR